MASVLAGKALQAMGDTTVFNIGGFKDVTEAGLETESERTVLTYGRARVEPYQWHRQFNELKAKRLTGAAAQKPTALLVT